MQVIIDGQAGPPAISENLSLKDAVQAVVKWAGEAGRVVLSVTLDGKPVGGIPEGSGPSSGRLLEVTTIGRQELVADTLRSLSQMLAGLERKHDEAAALAVDGNEAAVEKFQACLEEWMLVVAGVQQVLPLVPDSGGPAVGKLSASLLDALGRFKEAFVARDFVRLGDQAQYELKPLVGEWREVVNRMAGGGGSGGASAP